MEIQLVLHAPLRDKFVMTRSHPFMQVLVVVVLQIFSAFTPHLGPPTELACHCILFLLEPIVATVLFMGHTQALTRYVLHLLVVTKVIALREFLNTVPTATVVTQMPSIVAVKGFSPLGGMARVKTTLVTLLLRF